ncbi:hypothetical protein DICPUDRAFT_77507 [Dictyostelium purpureum]|uniref:Folylpolyglutamate synthase n=1 Tax=Dictyostelium purpureum TaxID=5786 RepID=F0ZGT5_DICPU|nr:uncharacterized protein DICPUDRAFT_77507 [Dictyostelium purpureum]EGC36829.1 hypothetical protein DICPUDRAFT_77507 [Dictyostelium purpureum]|eukprot:XP_003286627.1 hypothetical protein DICPUDRAFT_77507 [Dictyostelium purpureum]
MLYSPKDRSYEEAVNALLSLQSNQSVIIQSTLQRKNDKETMGKIILEEMTQYCKSIDIDFDKLSVIHVAGTKGKGSTCAITESLIRNQGFTTGLFTSPHLISPRERIRINGEMISKELFTKYFWICWDTLIKDFDTQLPNYFRYLTLMALKAFQDQGVQCIILEVGIGGRMDATNVVPKTAVSGISALGFDHMNLLGDTLPEIALEKACIMKKGVPVFTVASQAPEAMKVIENHSKLMESPLSVAPTLLQYNFSGDIGLKGEHQRENASLAVALANCWIAQQKHIPLNQIFNSNNNNKYNLYNSQINNYSSEYFTPLLESFEKGLRDCQWPGRAQHFTSEHFPNIDFYLDGAHTPESSVVCVNWWKSVASNDSNTIHAMIFNSTGGRNPNSFLKPIIDSIDNKEIPIFNLVLIPTLSIGKAIDNKYYIKEIKNQSNNSNNNNNNNNNIGSNVIPDKAATIQPKEDTWEDYCVNRYIEISTNNPHPVEAFENIESSIEKIKELGQNGKKNVKVLVTGSLYLIGGVLQTLLKEKSFT